MKQTAQVALASSHNKAVKLPLARHLPEPVGIQAPSSNHAWVNDHFDSFPSLKLKGDRVVRVEQAYLFETQNMP
jgi:hypothetical protein